MSKPARLSLLAVIVAILAALIGGWVWIAIAGKQRALSQVRAQAAVATATAQDNFTDAVRSIDFVLEMADRAMASRDLASLRSDREASRILADLTARLGTLQSMWILDPKGKLVFGEAAALQGSDLAGSDFFRTHLRGPSTVFVGASLREQDGSRFIPISRRLERSGALGGVMLTAVNPTWFQRIGNALRLHDKASFSVLTRQGGIVASTDAQVEALDPAMRRLLADRAIAAGDFDSYTIVVPSAEGDRNILIGSRPMKGLNLIGLYAVPYVTALQAWSSQLWIGSTVLGVVILAVIGGAIVMMLYGRRQGDLQRVLGLRTAEAAQAVERLALAVDTTGIGIFDYHMGKTDIAWAGVDTTYFGLRAPPDLNPRSMLRAVHPADRPGLMKRLRTLKAARDDMRIDTEFRLRHPEFGAIWVAARARLFTRNGNGAGRLIGTLRDITERRRLQEHRETVLREINHRIKNSLQLMNSIMNLQARRITSLEERGRFEAARRRLISLATVYAHLDDTTQPDVVELVPFLRRLCQDFSVAYMADGRISLSFSATGSTPISATLAVPLGMAMGELLVNISLNGFAPQATGAVSVNVVVAGDQCEITVSHNGQDAAQAFEGDGATLGRLLIDAFVDQLGGTFKVEDRTPGLAFDLRFRVPPVTTARPISQAQSERG